MRQKRHKKKRSRRLQNIFWLLALFLFTGYTHQASAEELTLERALEIAFKNSPSIQEAQYNLDISRHNLEAERAGLKSQFNLTLTPYRYSNVKVFNELASQYNIQELTKSEARFSVIQPILWTGGEVRLTNIFGWQEASSSFTGSVKESQFNNSLFLQLSQPLFTYNQRKMQLTELELSLENAQLNYAIQKLQIERQVTQQFLNLFFSWRSLEIAEQQLKNSRESYEIIESKVEAGISAPEELYQADLTLANSQSSLQNQKTQYDNAKDSFKILLGLPLEEELIIVADIRKSLVDVDLSKALDFGLTHRMELKQNDIAIQNALNDLIVAGAVNEFKAEVSATLGLTGTDPAFGQIYEAPNVDQVVQVSVNIPLFDWGRKKHILAASQAQVDSQRLSASEEIKNIKLEIREAFRILQNQKTQIEIAEKNVINAQRTYEINLERYKGGDLSAYDMQLFQLQLTQEQLDEVQALINYKLALLDLKIRTLWDFENNISVIDIKAGDSK
ncbi:MAG: TolC family protein [Candidatus Aminicenantes bacterium]|jgi:outer membrane protein TolC